MMLGEADNNLIESELNKTRDDFFTFGYNSGASDVLSKLFDKIYKNCPSNQIELLKIITDFRRDNVFFEYTGTGVENNRMVN